MKRRLRIAVFGGLLLAALAALAIWALAPALDGVNVRTV